MRRKPRVPYEDFYINSDEFLSDSEDEIYKDTPRRCKKKKNPKKKKSVDEDKEFIPTDHLNYDLEEITEEKHCQIVKNVQKSTNNQKVKMELQQFVGLNKKYEKTTNDGDIHLSPMGTPCEFVPFDKIKNKILRPNLYFPEGCNNINTLLPAYDHAAEDKLQFFGLEGQVPLFEMDYIENLGDEDIDELISEIDYDLDLCDPGDKKNIVVVAPFDGDLTDSVSIRADVTTFDWKDLGERIQFDVILMDPPWCIQDTKNTRGLELSYKQMKTEQIAEMPLNLVQKDGFLFMWVVASIIPSGLDMMKNWGYKVINCVNWIKTSSKGRYKPSNGYYLQHNKETCLVGVKGKKFENMEEKKFNDLIICQRNLRQSHKPEELYDIIEDVFPNGNYLEVFARSHNLRNGWVSLGLEVPK